MKTSPRFFLRMPVMILLLLCGAATVALAQSATITVQANAPGKPISPLLVGVFFEDLNYAADGGLYAELVQNRSFEYHAREQPTWNNLTSWELVLRGGAKGSLKVDGSFPLHANNPYSAALAAENPGEGVALINGGFDGIPVRTGERYELSFFARQNHFGRRWADVGKRGALPLTVRLETKDGAVLAETAFEINEREWRRYSATLTASQTEPAARLVILLRTQGGISLDEVSLFPQKTFRDRANGLRADLAQAIADLKPKFMRFPGGCLVHGNGLGNMYRWKDTIGPVEQRRQQYNLWGYHQTVGLGYFEYFQFCEDIGAQPLPVVAAGVCCQNSGHGIGQAGLPLEEMDEYIQEILDLIEWANGPVTSTWGAKRAAAGHPAPFGLKYLGVGNEDQISPEFCERFKMIHDAVRAKHPEIVVVGTSGPFPDGEDFDNGWKIARELKVAMVDEHYYKPPQWFWDNLRRYDRYDRTGPKVYVGEYAAHDEKRRSTLRSAIAEAAFLTSLERNGDVVHLASYAPLLARRGHTQWTPDLIYFNGTEVFPTINYAVQKLFGENGGDTYLTTEIAGDGAEAVTSLAASAVRDGKSGDVILKIVNGASAARKLKVVLADLKTGARSAVKTVLAGDNASVANEDGKPPAVQPKIETVAIGQTFEYEAPANSLTVLRVKGD